MAEQGDDTQLIYEFGGFRLDPAQGRLWRNGEPVMLRPKLLAILLLLIRNRGRILTKEELMEALWPDTFVEEGNLTQSMFTLRKHLGDDGDLIRTVPRQGYKFVAAVAVRGGMEIERFPHTRRLLRLLEDMVKQAANRRHIEPAEYVFTRATVQEFTGWGDTQLRVHLGRLEKMEYLIVQRGGRQGQRYVYRLGCWQGGKVLEFPPQAAAQPQAVEPRAAYAHGPRLSDG